MSGNHAVSIREGSEGEVLPAGLVGWVAVGGEEVVGPTALHFVCLEEVGGQVGSDKEGVRSGQFAVNQAIPFLLAQGGQRAEGGAEKPGS